MSKPSRRTGATEPIPRPRKNHPPTTYTHAEGSKIPFAPTKRTAAPFGEISYPDIPPPSTRSSPDTLPYPLPETPTLPPNHWTLSMNEDNSLIQGAIRRNNIQWKNVLRQYSNDLREARKGRKLSEEELAEELERIAREKKKMARERRRSQKLTRWLATLLVGVSVLLYYVGTGTLTFYQAGVPDLFSWVAQTPEEVLLGVGVKRREGEVVDWGRKHGEKEKPWSVGSALCGYDKETGALKKEFCDVARTNYRLAYNALMVEE